MNPRWREVVEKLAERERQQRGSVPYRVRPTLYPPPSLRGDQVAIQRGIQGQSSQGIWLIWSARGPFACVKRRGGWAVSPDNELGGEVGEELRELREWWKKTPLRAARFKTRREAITVLRAALAESCEERPGAVA